MASLDTALRRIARSLIVNFGTEVTITNVTPGAYNPATGTHTPTTSSATVKGRLEEYSSRLIETGLIQVGDRRLFVAASDLSFEPKPEDEVTISSAVYRIVDVRTLRVVDEAAVYDLQLRGAA